MTIAISTVRFSDPRVRSEPVKLNFVTHLDPNSSHFPASSSQGLVKPFSDLPFSLYKSPWKFSESTRDGVESCGRTDMVVRRSVQIGTISLLHQSMNVSTIICWTVFNGNGSSSSDHQ